MRIGPKRDIFLPMQLPLIAVVGLTGSGKTEVTQAFVAAGFSRVGFNDVFYEEFSKRKLEVTEPNERVVRDEMRKEFGNGVMALKALPKVEALVAQGRNVVVESLYSWSEYKVMKERFQNQFKVLAIYVPPSLRYVRLSSRATRPLTPEMACSRDYAEIEAPVEKAGPIAMADWTIQNLGSRENFLKEVKTFISSFLGL